MDAFPYLKAAHLLGIIAWLGPMLCIALVFARKADTPNKASLVPLMKRCAMISDWGATLAIGCGIGLILVSKPLGDAWAMKQPWMHTKLLIVLGLIGLHGVMRVGIKRTAKGSSDGVPNWLLPVVLLVAIAILYLVVVRP